MLENKNDKEISEIKAQLEDLRLGIMKKEKEIDIKNKQIGIFEMRFDDKILELEKKNEFIERELKKLKDENELMRNTLTGKDKEEVVMIEKEIVVEAASDVNLEGEVQESAEEIEELVDEKKCDKCDFIGKTEAGLKIHTTAKHKVSIMKIIIKLSRKYDE